MIIKKRRYPPVGLLETGQLAHVLVPAHCKVIEMSDVDFDCVADLTDVAGPQAWQELSVHSQTAHVVLVHQLGKGSLSALGVLEESEGQYRGTLQTDLA